MLDNVVVEVKPVVDRWMEHYNPKPKPNLTSLTKYWEKKNLRSEQIKKAQKNFLKKNPLYKKEEKNSYKKEWYQKNKEEVLEKINCECGVEVTKHNLPRHLKTRKHEVQLEKKKLINRMKLNAEQNKIIAEKHKSNIEKLHVNV